MAVLPENIIDLSGGVEFVAQPSLTWKIDRAAGRIPEHATAMMP